MRKTLQTIAAQTGAVVVEAFGALVMFAAAGVGGWVVYHVPNTPTASTAVVAGWFGLAFAFGINGLLETFMASLRALTRTSSSPATPATGLTTEDKQEALARSTEDVMDLLDEAARAGAAHEAAMYSGKVDPAGTLLDKRGLWVGVDSTSALFRLSDGAYVYYEKDESGKYPTHEYSFTVPETGSEPVPVTSMEQVRDLLEQHVTRELEDKPVAV